MVLNCVGAWNAYESFFFLVMQGRSVGLSAPHGPALIGLRTRKDRGTTHENTREYSPRVRRPLPLLLPLGELTGV